MSKSPIKPLPRKPKWPRKPSKAVRFVGHVDEPHLEQPALFTLKSGKA